MKQTCSFDNLGNLGLYDLDYLRKFLLGQLPDEEADFIRQRRKTDQELDMNLKILETDLQLNPGAEPLSTVLKRRAAAQFSRWIPAKPDPECEEITQTRLDEITATIWTQPHYPIYQPVFGKWNIQLPVPTQRQVKYLLATIILTGLFATTQQVFYFFYPASTRQEQYTRSEKVTVNNYNDSALLIHREQEVAGGQLSEASNPGIPASTPRVQGRTRYSEHRTTINNISTEVPDVTGTVAFSKEYSDSLDTLLQAAVIFSILHDSTDNYLQREQLANFVQTYGLEAIRVGRKFQLPPSYILMTAAHTSNYGQSRLTSLQNNFFAIRRPDTNLDSARITIRDGGNLDSDYQTYASHRESFDFFGQYVVDTILPQTGYDHEGCDYRTCSHATSIFFQNEKLADENISKIERYRVNRLDMLRYE